MPQIRKNTLQDAKSYGIIVWLITAQEKCSGIEVVITGLTRNQFASNRTRVRIPPSPPKIIILTIEKLKRLATFRLGIKSLIILISKNLIDHRLVHTQVITGRYSLT